MYGKILIQCDLIVRTGMHIGASGAFSAIGAVDSPDSGHLYFHDERNGQCCDLRQHEFENDLCQDNGKLEPPGL